MKNTAMSEATQEAIRHIERNWMVVQLKGVCPICRTGRSQYGECVQGHIVFEDFETVEPPAQSAPDAAAGE